MESTSSSTRFYLTLPCDCGHKLELDEEHGLIQDQRGLDNFVFKAHGSGYERVHVTQYLGDLYAYYDEDYEELILDDFSYYDSEVNDSYGIEEFEIEEYEVMCYSCYKHYSLSHFRLVNESGEPYDENEEIPLEIEDSLKSFFDDLVQKAG